MKKRIVMSLFIIGCAVMGLVKVTGAFFSSQAQSILNQFSTSNMKILVADGNQTNGPIVSHSWEMANIKPGDIIPQQYITVRNDSNISANHMDIAFSYTGSDNIAKNIFMTATNNGFRYGVNPADTSSVSLLSTLKGNTDIDYQVLKANGTSISTIDGVDGTTADGKISLSELATFGKIRIAPGTAPDSESDGIRAGSEAMLWLNAEVGQGLTAQSENLDVTITFTLDQDASQF